MGDLTEHFSIAEFAQRDPYRPVPAKYRANVQRLANQLQELRDVVGRIVITSSYRTRAHNTAIGGATNSQHLTAKAADFVVPDVPQSEVYCTILRLIPGSMEQGGLGWYGESGHIHYDVRGSKSRWNKSGGALPVCPKIELPPEEEDEMKLILLYLEDNRHGAWWLSDWMGKRSVGGMEALTLYRAMEVTELALSQDLLDTIPDIQAPDLVSGVSAAELAAHAADHDAHEGAH